MGVGRRANVVSAAGPVLTTILVTWGLSEVDRSSKTLVNAQRAPHIHAHTEGMDEGEVLVSRFFDTAHKIAGLGLTLLGVLLALIVTGNLCAPLGYYACFGEKVLGRPSPTKVVAAPEATAPPAPKPAVPVRAKPSPAAKPSKAKRRDAVPGEGEDWSDGSTDSH
jgi:hypothetical protein